jgi:hypothetical protein
MVAVESPSRSPASATVSIFGRAIEAVYAASRDSQA